MFDCFVHQYVLPMELITSDSFGKWMQVFQSVVNREVPQVRIVLVLLDISCKNTGTFQLG